MFIVLISVLWSKITPECNTHFSALIFSFLVFSVFFVCVCVSLMKWVQMIQRLWNAGMI